MFSYLKSRSIPTHLGSIYIASLSLCCSIPSTTIYHIIYHVHYVKKKKKKNLDPLVLARAAKATGSSHALLQLLYFDNLGGHDPLEHQLSNSVALLDLIVGVGVVEEENLDGPAVVCVNDTGAGVDEVLGGEARAGSDSAI